MKGKIKIEIETPKIRKGVGHKAGTVAFRNKKKYSRKVKHK